MFGLSFWEIGIILAVALIVLGPKQLPQLARKLGEGLREFRRATEDFKSTVSSEAHKPDPIPPTATATAMPSQQEDTPGQLVDGGAYDTAKPDEAEESTTKEAPGKVEASSSKPRPKPAAGAEPRSEPSCAAELAEGDDKPAESASPAHAEPNAKS